MNFSAFTESRDNSALAAAAAEGRLLDLYSDKWLGAKAGGPLALLSATQLRQEYGQAIFHHLYVFYLDSNPHFRDALLSIAPELEWQFAETLHAPDFVFINTLERMTLSVGLGRKNRLFVLHPSRDVRIEVNFLEPSTSCHDTTLRRFTSCDHCHTVWTVCGALERVGEGYYYNNPKLVVANRATLREFFPFLDTRQINTRDY